MSKLIYIANVSLDGYIEDSHGNFDWTTPNDEVFAFITDLVRSAGTYLYGRRMYETMPVWETDPALAAQSEPMSDFAHVWQAANKVVYSTTLHEVSTAKTQLERNFDPNEIRDLKASAANCSSGLYSSARASRPSLTTRVLTSSSSTSAGSAVVSCTSVTASRPDHPARFRRASPDRDRPRRATGRVGGRVVREDADLDRERAGSWRDLEGADGRGGCRRADAVLACGRVGTDAEAAGLANETDL